MQSTILKPETTGLTASINRYSYEKCLERVKKVNWKIEDILSGKSFNIHKRWLPEKLSSSQFLTSWDADSLRKLSHIEMSSYAHLFGYVEEFIAPLIAQKSTEHAIDNKKAFEALNNFVNEEIKHMELFRAIRKIINKQLDLDCKLLDNNKEVAKHVLSKSAGSVLLLIACIEWLTQRHYLDSIKDENDLDLLTKKIFKAHWLEEAQHAQLDHLETLKEFKALDERAKSVAATDLADLILALDSLLQVQSEYDVINFEAYTKIRLSSSGKAELQEAILKAKRYTFISSGTTHPEFQKLFTLVFNKEQQNKVVGSLTHII